MTKEEIREKAVIRRVEVLKKRFIEKKTYSSIASEINVSPCRARGIAFTALVGLCRQEKVYPGYKGKSDIITRLTHNERNIIRTAATEQGFCLWGKA